MTGLLLAACGTLYAVQRRQLYRAFDDALGSGANSIVMLIHHRSPEFWFDFDELATLPVNRVCQDAVFQFWSDYPIYLSSGPVGPDRLGGPGAYSTTSPSIGPPDFFGDRDEPPGARRGPPRDLAGPPRSRRSEPLAAGVYVIRSPLLKNADLPKLPAPDGKPRIDPIVLPSGAHGRAVSMELHWDTPERGPWRAVSANLTAVVAASTSEIETQLRFLATLLAMTALGTIVVSTGVAWLVVSRGLRPLAAVAGRIAAMDESALKQRIEDTGAPHEIAPVVHQLNGLLQRLDQAFDRERALTADVAHELRTPVAEIRTIAEITLSHPRSPEEYGEALRETLDTTQTLQSLIEKLLVLARLESGQMKPELEPIPLQPLLAERWAQIRERAEVRGITFEDRCPPDTIVPADLKLLSIVFGNVLSNAVTYVPDHGRIMAEIETTGQVCRLHLANTGCELAEDEVDKVFDRFWRADPARSRGSMNCGLGLTLVRRAMEAMQGGAWARVNSDHHFILTLEFALPEDRG